MQKKKYVYFGMGLFVLLLVGFILKKPANTIGTLQSSNGIMTPLQGEFKTFTSQNLGVSFDYNNQKNSPVPLLVKEIGDKVYLYHNFSKVDDPTSGKFVEVFTKNPSDSLATAVKKQFLQGYSPNTCPILPAAITVTKINPARQYVQITIPIIANTNMAEKLNLEKQCPPTYTFNRRTGLVYFMMDPNNPDKFVFFKIGQDNVLGAPTNSKGVGLNWDQTLRFTGK